MRIMNFILLAVFFLIFISTANAAVIKGNIYGPDLSIIEEVSIKIYSDERVVQSFVINDGSYTIELEPGDYDIEGAFIEQGEIILLGREQIKVEDGEYNIDLILLPESNYEDFNDFDLNTNIEGESNGVILWVVILVIALIVLYYLYSKKIWVKKNEVPKGELSKELKELIKIIEKAGGRINQLDLRKQLPYSEAKASLMIAELESMGMIKKIKKGRGNILVLNR